MMTLYENWQGLNERFMTEDGLKIIKVAGVYTSIPQVTIHAQGFGLPESSVLLRDKRVDLLEQRYINDEVWEACKQRFHRAASSATHVFRFERTGKGPKAGGCLLSVVLIKEGKRYRVMITSRAEEATMAMLADIAFLERTLDNLARDLNISNDWHEITWHIGLTHQNRVFVPVYMFDVYGARGFHRWLKRKPRNEWERVCIEHTHKMLTGEGVTGARKLWGRRLKEWTSEA